MMDPDLVEGISRDCIEAQLIYNATNHTRTYPTILEILGAQNTPLERLIELSYHFSEECNLNVVAILQSSYE